MDDNTPVQNISSLFTRKRVFAVVFITTFLLFIFWFCTHSVIEVSVENFKPGGVTYTITDQQSGNKTKASSDKPTFKKILKKGDYIVSVQSAGSSYLTTVKTTGLLHKSSVSAKLVAEKSREFVGGSPDPCMYYTGSVLYSYSCSGSFEDLRAHIPASDSTPTVVQTPPKGASYGFGGIVRSDGQDLAVIKASGFESSDLTTLYPLNDDFILKDGVVPAGLDQKPDYSGQNFQDGFILYDNSFKHIYYYKTIESKPEKLSVPSLKDDSFAPKSLSMQGGRIAIVYTDATDQQDEDLDQEAIKGGETIVKIYDHESKQTKEFSLSSGFSQVSLCGTHYLCAVNGRLLEVYDISGEKINKTFSAPDVQAFGTDTNGENLIFATSKEVIGFNPEKNEGSIEYSLGGYDLCGLQTAAAGVGGYTLCLTDVSNNRFALYVNTSLVNSDDNDKKILKIGSNAKVATIAPYKKIIYISPEVGKRVYDTATNSFIYNRDTISRANASVQKSIDDSGLASRGYIFINPYSSY